MLSITLICVGRLKERFFEEAAYEYIKRLSPMCVCSIREISEERIAPSASDLEISRALLSESRKIRLEIPKGAYVAALCIEGKPISSQELSNRISELKMSGTSQIAFIIGGSNGLSPEIKAFADMRLSMSQMTFPHHLARVMLLEQIYRALSIEAGTKYHK